MIHLLRTSAMLAVMTLASAAGFCQHGTTKMVPNIVLIMSDDHTTQAISAYDKRLMPTPHIDRIGTEGARLSNYFCTNALCAPSRAVILTGKYSHINGMRTNRKGEVFDGSQQTFPKLLQQHGYQTAIIGKWHLVSEPTGFDHWEILPGQGAYYNPDFINSDGTHREKGYVTNLITDKAVAWMKEETANQRPFMLMVHHKAPHGTWLPDLKYLDHLEDVEFPFPDNFFDSYATRGRAAKEQEMEIATYLKFGRQTKFEYDPYTGEPTDFKRLIDRMEPDQLKAWRAVYTPLNEAAAKNQPTGKALAKFKFQRYIKDYLKCIKSIDDGVGEILNYLDTAGLSEETIVIYTSDQGFFLGEHGWYDKRFMYEEALRTPMLIRYPPEIAKETIMDEITMNLDLAPTLLDFAGASVPADLQGRSMRNLLAGKKEKDWRDAMYYHFYEYPGPQMVKKHYGIRTDRYKLIHFYDDIDEWELYDLDLDPQEMNNVYNNPSQSETQRQLHTKLKQIRTKYHDTSL